MKKNQARTDPRVVVLSLLLVVSGVSFASSSGLAPRAMQWATNQACMVIGVLFTGNAGDLATPVDGLMWYDTTRQAFRGQTTAGIAGMALLFAPAITDSGTLSNPTSATPFSTKVTFPIGSLTAGKSIWLRAYGRYTTGTAITPTLNLGVNVGGSALATSGLLPVSISLTNQAWFIESGFIVRTVGAGGTMVGWTRGSLGGLLALTTPTNMIGRSGSVALNTTAARDVEVTALFGASDAANAATLEGLEVYSCN